MHQRRQSGLRRLSSFAGVTEKTAPAKPLLATILDTIELEEAVCCLLQPMIVGWDAYYIPHSLCSSLDYFVAVSHDSFIDVHCRTREMHDKALKILEQHGWIKPLLRADD